MCGYRSRTGSFLARVGSFCLGLDVEGPSFLFRFVTVGMEAFGQGRAGRTLFFFFLGFFSFPSWGEFFLFPRSFWVYYIFFSSHLDLRASVSSLHHPPTYLLPKFTPSVHQPVHRPSCGSFLRLLPVLKIPSRHFLRDAYCTKVFSCVDPSHRFTARESVFAKGVFFLSSFGSGFSPLIRMTIRR